MHIRFYHNKHCYRIVVSITVICYLSFTYNYFTSPAFDGGFVSTDFLKQVQKIAQLDKEIKNLCYFKTSIHDPHMKTCISIFSDDSLFISNRYDNFIKTDDAFPIEGDSNCFYLVEENSKDA